MAAAGGPDDIAGNEWSGSPAGEAKGGATHAAVERLPSEEDARLPAHCEEDARLAVSLRRGRRGAPSPRRHARALHCTKL